MSGLTLTHSHPLWVVKWAEDTQRVPTPQAGQGRYPINNFVDVSLKFQEVRQRSFNRNSEAFWTQLLTEIYGREHNRH